MSLALIRQPAVVALNPEQQRQAMIAVGDEAKENFTYRMDPAAPLAIVECRPI